MADERLAAAVVAASNTTSTSDLMVFLLPRVLSLTSALLGNSSENTTVLTKEILDVASKVFTLDGDSTSSFAVNPILFDLSSVMWPLYFISIPVLIGGVIWYFVTTFVLGKNVLGRRLSSLAEREGDGVMDNLTKKVMQAAEGHKYS